MGGDEIEAGPRQRQGHPVVGLPALTQPDHGEQQGEHHLGLQYQRGHARRHAELHGAEQKGELAQTDGASIGQQPAPGHGGSGDQQDGGKDHADEAQRPQQQRGYPLQPPLDGDEVEPPAEDDQSGQKFVLGVHAASFGLWPLAGEAKRGRAYPSLGGRRQAVRRGSNPATGARCDSGGDVVHCDATRSQGGSHGGGQGVVGDQHADLPRRT